MKTISLVQNYYAVSKCITQTYPRYILFSSTTSFVRIPKSVFLWVTIKFNNWDSRECFPFIELADYYET